MAERKLTRHEMREAALLILFQRKLNPETLDELLEDCKESFEFEYNSQSVKLANGVEEHEDELNAIIESYSPSRKLNRICQEIYRQGRRAFYKRRTQFVL